MRKLPAITAWLDKLAEYLAAFFIVLVMVGFGVAAWASVSAAEEPIPDPGGYHPGTAEDIGAEIDEFFGAGAVGYIIWQYSGDKNAALGNDPWSFFRGTPEWDEVCAMLKSKSGGTQFLGVNMWDIGSHPDQAYSHFTHLRNDCGVSVVRVFAKAGGAAGMQEILSAAQSANMQIIIAVGDFANGGGGFSSPSHDSARAFYGGGYKGEYMDFAASIAPLASHPAVKIIELANEPHCFEFADVLPAYQNWVRDGAALFSGAGARNVGIGQMANVPASACDYGAGFVSTNSVAGITMASGHHYTPDEKAANLAMLATSPKPFYVGEANTKGPTKKQDVNPLDNEKFDAEKYFLYPIKGLIDQNQGVFYQDLKDQGYEVNCTHMPVMLVEGTEGFDDGSILFDKISDDGDRVRTNVEQIFDFIDAKAPNWRSQLDSKNPFSSLEDHLGYQDPTIYNQGTVELNPENGANTGITSAPYYRLTTIEQQCEDKKKMLTAIENLCLTGSSVGSDGCALQKPVPGSTMTPADIKAAIGGESCKSIAAQLAEPNPADKYKALINVPLYLDNAYRLAFLVISTELTGPEDKEEIPKNVRFAFYRCHSPECQQSVKDPDGAHRNPYSEVRVFAFKLPDTAADNRDPNSLVYYDDAAQQTRNALLPKKEIENQAKIYEAIRNYEATSESIDCGGSKYCENRLVQALVGFVNNRARDNSVSPKTVAEVSSRPPCSYRNMTSEDSFDKLLNTPVEITTKGGDNPYNLVIDSLRNAKIGQATDNIGYRSAGSYLPTTAYVLEGWGDAERPTRSLPWTTRAEFYTKTKAWVIYPKRYQYDTVNNALASLIYTLKQREAYDEKFSPSNQTGDNARFFRLIDQFLKTKTKDVESHTVQHWLDLPEGKCYWTRVTKCNIYNECAEVPERICPSETLHLRINAPFYGNEQTLKLHQTRIWGGELGYVLRDIQRALRSERDKVHKYLVSCDAGIKLLSNPTEAFLTGTCKEQRAAGAQSWCQTTFPGLMGGKTGSSTTTAVSSLLGGQNGSTTSEDSMSTCMSFLENKSPKELTCFENYIKYECKSDQTTCLTNGISKCSSTSTLNDTLCPYRTATTEILSEEKTRDAICAAAKAHDVPGFMLRGLLAIEGGEYNRALLSGKYDPGETVPCVVSKTGDVGPFQIHVNSCIPPNESGSQSQPAVTGTAPTADLCSFSTAVDLAASTLSSKADALAGAYSMFRPGDRSNWTYDFAYKAAGLYNGDSAENCAAMGEASKIRVDGAGEYTYCRFAVESFDETWSCPGDPVLVK